MILVTLGTQDRDFKRLLDAIQKQIDIGNIKERVVVQAGYTKYKSKEMEIFDLIPFDEFDNLIKNCDLLITHGGVGSIINGLKNNTKIIAAARLSKYKEAANDHQKQIINNFYEAGYILKLENFNKLDKILIEAKQFSPQKFKSNTKKFIKTIENFIDNN